MELNVIRQADPQVADAIEAELNRQRSHIELIASENFVSPAVMAAMGSCLTNKYAEGYPAHRYYGGCECVDVVENLARDRAEQLFGCEYVNVQPHSGAQANTAVYFAMLQPGDTVMGMSLSNGGHLTHGSPVNLSGKYFHFVPYGVDAQGYIDYDAMRALALECKPKMIVSGASAYPRTIDFEKIRAICDEVGALMMVDIAHIAGLVAAGWPADARHCGQGGLLRRGAEAGIQGLSGADYQEREGAGSRVPGGRHQDGVGRHGQPSAAA